MKPCVSVYDILLLQAVVVLPEVAPHYYFHPEIHSVPITSSKECICQNYTPHCLQSPTRNLNKQHSLENLTAKLIRTWFWRYMEFSRPLTFKHHSCLHLLGLVSSPVIYGWWTPIIIVVLLWAVNLYFYSEWCQKWVSFSQNKEYLLLHPFLSHAYIPNSPSYGNQLRL